MPTPNTARRYVTPDPDAFAGNVGQLVMRSSAVRLAGAGIDFSEGHGDALITGRVIGRYWHGDQYHVMWDNGRKTWETTVTLVEIQAVRFVASVEARAEMLVFYVVPAVLGRFEVRREVFHPSTDGSLGYRLSGFADVLPSEDDHWAWEESYFTDRYKLADITAHNYCRCQCHNEGDEIPF